MNCLFSSLEEGVVLFLHALTDFEGVSTVGVIYVEQRRHVHRISRDADCFRRRGTPKVSVHAVIQRIFVNACVGRNLATLAHFGARFVQHKNARAAQQRIQAHNFGHRF